MVGDQGKCPYCVFIWLFLQGIFDKEVAHRKTDGFGTWIPIFIDHLVELVEKLGRSRNRESGHAFGIHGITELS